METLIAFAKNKIRIVRFLISGGSSSAANLVILYVLTEYAGMHYLQSEIFGYACGFFSLLFFSKNSGHSKIQTDRNCRNR